MEVGAKRESDFYTRVYKIVANIPVGRVTTYGLIAQTLGMKSSARMVGYALNAGAGSLDFPFHRVVNRNGDLTGKRYFNTPFLMKELLISEGVGFIGDRVNLKLYLWNPEIK